MIVVEVDPGVCRLSSTVRITSHDGRKVHIDITSECQSIRDLARELNLVDAFTELYSRDGLPSIYHRLRKFTKHTTCPVPLAILKGIEAAIGFAAPKDVNIRIQEVEDNSEG